MNDSDASTPDASTPDAARALRASLEEYGRGVAGGLLFSLPLLYTMEMWWAGISFHPTRLLAAVVATFLLLLAYNRFAGLREDASRREVVIDSIEEMGIGILLSVFILWLLHRIHGQMPLAEVMGKIVLEALVVAIGVSVGTAQLGANSEEQGTSENEKQTSDFLKQTVIALCGAILIAANVGPTEEILILAIESPPAKLLVLAIFSLALTLLILNGIDFRGAGKFVLKSNAFEIARGAITTYAAALAASAALCWLFGRFDGASWEVMIAQTVTLGFPASLGASAGSLLLQANSQ